MPTALRGHVFSLEACDRPLRRATGGLGLSKETDADKNRKTSANGPGPARCHVDTFCGDHSSRNMDRRVLAGRFPATTFCHGSKDMPTQSRLRRAPFGSEPQGRRQSSRGHGTRRKVFGPRGTIGNSPAFQRWVVRAPFFNSPSPGRGGRALRGEGRTSRRGAEHAEKAKTGEGGKPLRSMKSSQADKISNVCRATKGKSRRSNLVPLSFSASSAPLREILFVFAGGSTKRGSPGAMPTARLSSTLRLRPEGSSPMSALRGHVFSLEACDRPLRRATGGLGLSKETDADKNRKTSANGPGPARCHVDTFCGDHSSRNMDRRVLPGRFPATTFRHGSKDMPTQSRGHGTRRQSSEGGGENLSQRRRARRESQDGGRSKTTSLDEVFAS